MVRNNNANNPLHLHNQIMSCVFRLVNRLPDTKITNKHNKNNGDFRGTVFFIREIKLFGK